NNPNWLATLTAEASTLRNSYSVALQPIYSGVGAIDSAGEETRTPTEVTEATLARMAIIQSDPNLTVVAGDNEAWGTAGNLVANSNAASPYTVGNLAYAANQYANLTQGGTSSVFQTLNRDIKANSTVVTYSPQITAPVEIASTMTTPVAVGLSIGLNGSVATAEPVAIMINDADGTLNLTGTR